MPFRIAFGPCSCSQRSRNQLVRALCERVLNRIEQLEHLSPEQLRALPEEEISEALISGRRAWITVYRSGLPDGGTLIAIQAFISSLRWPTFIGVGGVGHVVAEGLVVQSAGVVERAHDSLMWQFR